MVVSLEIKSTHSLDVEVDAWVPAAPEDVYFLLELEIGERGDDRADLFHVVVATREGLRRVSQKRKGPPLHGALLVLPTFSWEALAEALDQILRDCEAHDWPRAVGLLQRHFDWEYAGMEERGR